MSSTIPAARTFLYEQLLANEDLSDVFVARTGIWQEKAPMERVEVLNARSIDREPRLGGARFRETYTIPVRVTAVRGGDDLETVEDRLWELVSVVEQTVLADGSLGGNVVHAVPAGSDDDGERSGPSENNTIAASLTLEIHCEARATLAA